MRVVINRCFGGFDLSDEGLALYNRLAHKRNSIAYDIPRDDPHLIEVVEILGDKASNEYSNLRIVEFPDDVQYTIQEYDGCEWVAEVHRTWQ
jgi:hypothetical protein